MLKRSGALCLILAALALGLAAAPAARAQGAGATKVNPKDGAVMVYVPAGAFTMGTDLSDIPEALQGGFKNAPKHMVTLSGYWIYKNDVTVAEYKAFCQATGRAMPEAPIWGWKANHPMENVTWADASAYAQWAGVSLPTEAQWEKAARGTDGRAYPWGNKWDASRCANSAGSNHLSSTKPSGSYPSGASPYGCLDMAGNVWQWCADWYDENHYNSAPSTNPTGPASGAARVLRGGSWNFINPDYFRAAYRGRLNPTYRFFSNGFRCCSRPD